MKVLNIISIALFLGLAFGAAPSKPQPILTLQEKATILQIQRDMMVIQSEIAPQMAQLRSKGEELQKIFKAHEVPGWQLNVQTLEYQKADEPKEKVKK